MGTSAQASGVTLSTHVLDAAGGGARPGVEVTVTDGDGADVARGTTDAAGRITDLAALAPGRYRVTWHVGGSLTVAVAVTVDLVERRHYHLPLLASDTTAVTYLGV